MTLRTGQDDNRALLGAYGRWLQYMADGAHTSGQVMVFPPGTLARAKWEAEPYRYSMCGAFIREAKHRNWVEKRGKDYFISARGFAALEEYRAWRSERGD